jgi:hypothetical protein
MPFLAPEEVHGPSTMGAQGFAFGKDPFVARHELSATHKTDVPLGAGHTPPQKKGAVGQIWQRTFAFSFIGVILLGLCNIGIKHNPKQIMQGKTNEANQIRQKSNRPNSSANCSACRNPST